MLDRTLRSDGGGTVQAAITRYTSGHCIGRRGALGRVGSSGHPGTRPEPGGHRSSQTTLRDDGRRWDGCGLPSPDTRRIGHRGASGRVGSGHRGVSELSDRTRGGGHGCQTAFAGRCGAVEVVRAASGSDPTILMTKQPGGTRVALFRRRWGRP